ncbi:MAG TPA: ThiF family adenylyltransferase [Streptosporangiaceae bacterium]
MDPDDICQMGRADVPPRPATTYHVTTEGAEHEWHSPTITVAQIRALAGCDVGQAVVEVDLDTGTETPTRHGQARHAQTGCRARPQDPLHTGHRVNTNGAARLPALDVLFQTPGEPATVRFAGVCPDQRAAGTATRHATRARPGPPAESRPGHAGGGSDTPLGAGGAELSERYFRQIALFGEAGQQRLRDASVVLIGLSGLGSHLAQQLAYLGVRRYTLLDADTVGNSSLNCLIGATGDDLGILKAHVAARLIRSIQPAADVRVGTEPVPLELLSAGAAVGSATAVIAGLGKDEGTMRFILTELCSIAGVPYVDVASGVRRAGSDIMYGGRVVVAGPAASCLFCRGELDRRESAHKAADPRERQARTASHDAGAAAVRQRRFGRHDQRSRRLTRSDRDLMPDQRAAPALRDAYLPSPRGHRDPQRRPPGKTLPLLRPLGGQQAPAHPRSRVVEKPAEQN